MWGNWDIEYDSLSLPKAITGIQPISGSYIKVITRRDCKGPCTIATSIPRDPYDLVAETVPTKLFCLSPNILSSPLSPAQSMSLQILDTLVPTVIKQLIPEHVVDEVKFFF